MNTKKIYVVSSFGGQFEDAWEHVECAFESENDAQEFVGEQNEFRKQIGNKLYDEIWDFLYDKENELWNEYHIEGTFDELIPGKTEEEYDKDYEYFHTTLKYELIKQKFNVDKELFDVVNRNNSCDFCDYKIEEIDLFLK